MRAARFILFGILLVLIGMSAPTAVAGLLSTKSGILNPALGIGGFYMYLAQIILIALGFLMGLIGLFLREPVPAPSLIDIPYTMPPLEPQRNPLPPDYY